MKRLAAIVGLALCLASCGGGSGGGDDEEPTSGAECPPNSSLTYQTFGQAFMNTYCTGCHSSEQPASARRGAPSDHNLDTIEGIRAVSPGHIDQTSAAGEARVNAAMPPANYDPKPSEVERRKLGEWLACGMP